jgi:ribosomal protein S18 acetylase RimI-like enzyme
VRAPQREIRRLVAADAGSYQPVQLEALQRHPDAFAASYDEELDQALETVARRLDQGTVFGAFVDGELAAIATYLRHPQRKRQHVAMVWGMYVREPYRGAGLARAVLEQVVRHAQGEVDQLELYVAMGNEPARGFYRRFGFEPYGVMPRSLRVDGVDHDAEMLALAFR